ncbi:MAG: hypothetical protein ABS52_07070 [Gemmatimonadetes bacterium SCN 70-22]|nr:MAG: hypothetical protein ABS52_07070 [Gemmatimonadetes bacterium SCN 70-22]
MPDEREYEVGALPPTARGNAKLQRWVDLVAALLTRSVPATFAELAHDVPEYALKLAEAEREPDEAKRRTKVESLKRAFERDKDELKEFGIPITTHEDEDGNASGKYRLKRADFYLPYLCFAVPGGEISRPATVDAWGYHALASLTFDADELQAVVDAAAGVRGLGEPLLAAHVESAMRKLAVDLPIDAALPSPDTPRVLRSRERPDAATFESLGEALRRRKVVTFAYHAMSTDRDEGRTVEPYGLFFLTGHWYLAGRDRARGELRNFRLNRMGMVAVNAKQPQTPDYEVPATFRLREHARSRHAWELGSGDANEAVVDFTGTSGPTVAAMKLGRAVDGAPTQRAFDVRRPDAFVRWVMSFAGEARPVSPGEVVARYRAEVQATARLYEGASAGENVGANAGAPESGASPGEAPSGARQDAASRPWEPKGAAAQLRRILQLVPQIANGDEVPLQDVAHRIGTTLEVLQHDLYSLVTRYDTPPGFVDGVQLFVEADRVSAVTNNLLRPMRLTVAELCALELGLALLRTHRPPDEHQVLDRARDRLRAVIARLPNDPIPDGLHGASLGEVGNTALLATVREALRERRKLRITYRKSGSAEPGDRVICPYVLVSRHGMLYIVAHCDREAGMRIFRMDRLESAERTGEGFERVEGFDIEEIFQDGRPFQHDGAATMRVRYSPRIARWIAEREGRALAPDGSLVMDHPLADWEWGMRHVLQYAAEAEVLAPAEMRERLRVRLEEMARQR